MFKRFLFCFAVLFCCSGFAYSYVQQKYIIKVSYLEKPHSSRSMELIKMSTPPNIYPKIVQKISEARIYYSLYVNTKTNESLLYKDSIFIDPQLITSGHIVGLYKNANDAYQGLDNIAPRDSVYFQSVLSDYKWKFDTAQKRINNVAAVKVHFEQDPDPEAQIWISTDIPATLGVDYYLATPGLILEMENLFRRINAFKIEYLDNDREMKEKLSKYLTLLQNKKSIPVKTLLINKKAGVDYVINAVRKYQREKN